VSFHRPHDKIGNACEKGFAVGTKNLWNRNSTTGLDELFYSDPNRQNIDVHRSDITNSFTEKIVKNQQNAEKNKRDPRFTQNSSGLLAIFNQIGQSFKSCRQSRIVRHTKQIPQYSITLLS
jgi:hypothetical protein